MDFNSLYSFSDTHLRGALHVRPRETFNKFALHKAEWQPTRSIIFEYSMGGAPRDLIGTEYAGLYLLSDRVIEIFKKEGFTGWTTYPVEIYGKKGERIPGYHGFAVTGRCGQIDNSRSKKVWMPPPPGGNPYQAWIGMYFDFHTWDGSDIFGPKGTTYTFVVERVKVALEKAKVKNIRFKRLTEIERSML